MKENILRPGAARGMVNWYRAIARYPGAPARGKIAAPTLLIWGEKDRALGKELTYDMDRLFTGPFRVHYVPDCSHWVNEEQPELVNRLLLEHLRVVGDVVVFGAAGVFGRHLARALDGVPLRLTARDPARLPGATRADVGDAASRRAALEGASIAVNCAGPFGALPLTLPEACADAGVHYVDIADDRGPGAGGCVRSASGSRRRGSSPRTAARASRRSPARSRGGWSARSAIIRSGCG